MLKWDVKSLKQGPELLLIAAQKLIELPSAVILKIQVLWVRATQHEFCFAIAIDAPCFYNPNISVQIHALNIPLLS